MDAIFFASLHEEEARRVDEPFTAIFDADAYRRRSKAPHEPLPDVADLAPVSFVSEQRPPEATIVA